MIFSWIRQRVWKTVKYQGKIWEKSGNFELDDKWQPCGPLGILCMCIPMNVGQLCYAVRMHDLQVSLL